MTAQEEVARRADQGEQAKNATKGDAELRELVEDRSEGERLVVNDPLRMFARPSG